jgi:hypothetical protein
VRAVDGQNLDDFLLGDVDDVDVVGADGHGHVAAVRRGGALVGPAGELVVATISLVLVSITLRAFSDSMVVKRCLPSEGAQTP